MYNKPYNKEVNAASFNPDTIEILRRLLFGLPSLMDYRIEKGATFQENTNYKKALEVFNSVKDYVKILEKRYVNLAEDLKNGKYVDSYMEADISFEDAALDFKLTKLYLTLEQYFNLKYEGEELTLDSDDTVIDVLYESITTIYNNIIYKIKKNG